MSRINKMIDELLREHEGGEIFFDALDSNVRDNNLNILEMMCERIESLYEDDDFDTIITSGKFGQVFTTFVHEHYQKYPWNMLSFVSVEGGLRKGNPISDFDLLLNYASGDYLFVDDSFYSGNTRDVVKGKIESYGGNLSGTLVFYDGSINRDETVSSFYRYYDNRGGE